MSGDKKPTLGYWDIRGLAQPARLMLHYAKVDYEETSYVLGEAPDFDRSQWMNAKYTLGLPFANLPYYVEGDLKICQSSAIYRHIARKHGLIADDEVSLIRMDMVEAQLIDLRNQFVTLVYRTFDDGKEAYETKTQPTFLKMFDEFLGSNDWFSGKKLTFVDFMAYEIFDQQRIFKKDCLDELTNLQAFMKRFEALPTIKAYFNSDKFVKLPINNKVAKWGNTNKY